ncbi:MAG: MFS transporter, partial [Rhodospirillaceae bacterium]
MRGGAGGLFVVTAAAAALCLFSGWPRGVMLDVMVSVFVSVVVASEVLSAWNGQAAGREVSRIRLALFVYLLGAELVRPFLVFFIDELYTPAFPFGHDVAIGLPYLSWGLAVIAATTFGTVLNHRFSPRTVFVAGCGLAVAASLLMAVATTLYQVILFRALTGAATGIVTLAALIFVTQNAPAKGQARSMAAFVGASVAGSIGGSALGGILAGVAGYRPVFLVIAAVIAGAAALGL